jgi:hypothetical protein
MKKVLTDPKNLFKTTNSTNNLFRPVAVCWQWVACVTRRKGRRAMLTMIVCSQVTRNETLLPGNRKLRLRYQVAEK